LPRHSAQILACYAVIYGRAAFLWRYILIKDFPHRYIPRAIKHVFGQSTLSLQELIEPDLECHEIVRLDCRAVHEDVPGLANPVGPVRRLILPVTPLVVSAGIVRVPQAFSDQVIPLASLPARLGPTGPSSQRVEQAYIEFSRKKGASGQVGLSARHRYRMAHGHRFDPVRALWVASVISLACALLALQHLASHHGSM
jgi:hypothetical protein